MQTKEVILPIGIPGIGKSTTLAQVLGSRPHTVVSPDEIRLRINNGKPFVPETEPAVWAQAKDEFTRSLRATTPESHTILVDATNITPVRRKTFLDLIRASGANCVLKVFQFPVDVELAMERQKGRERQVDRSIVEQMARAFKPFSAGEAKGMAFQIHTVDKNGDIKSLKTA